MKVLSTDGLTKLIQLIKSAFISVDDTVTTTTVELADVATTGDYDDLINTPAEVTESTVSGWGFTKNTGTVTSVNNVSPVNGNVTLTADNVLPSQTSQSGKFLTTNGTSTSWAVVDALPSQTSQSGKFLTTNGTTASWATITMPTVDQTYDSTSTNAQSGVAIAGAGFLTSINSTMVTNALGYTPYDATNPNRYTSVSVLSDLTNVSISNPTQGQNLTYDATMGRWKNTSTTVTVAWGGITGTLADQTDLKNALDDKYDASNPNGYTSNVGTVTSVNNISPVNGNVTLSIPSTDNLANKDLSNLSSTGNAKFQAPLVSGTNIKTINSTSILGSGDISALQNTATGNLSLAIEGFTSSASHATSVGYSSAATTYSSALGYNAKATAYYSTSVGDGSIASGLSSSAFGETSEAKGNYSVAIGSLAKTTDTATNSIQIGYGTNSVEKTLSIGFGGGYNYQLLDGQTGLIPDARLSSNIARASAIPTESTVSGWGFTKNVGTVTSVNNVSPVNGNVTLSIPTQASDIGALSTITYNSTTETLTFS